jgi:thioredoxin-related protein
MQYCNIAKQDIFEETNVLSILTKVVSLLTVSVKQHAFPVFKNENTIHIKFTCMFAIIRHKLENESK